MSKSISLLHLSLNEYISFEVSTILFLKSGNSQLCEKNIDDNPIKPSNSSKLIGYLIS